MKGAQIMSSYFSLDFVKEIRVRLDISRAGVLDNMFDQEKEEISILSESTIIRAEMGRQSMRLKNFYGMMGFYEMPVDAFFCSFMENQTMELLKAYDALSYNAIYASENKFCCQKGVSLLHRLKKSGAFDEGLNKQLLISNEAVFMEVLGQKPTDIRTLIHRGLEVTHPELINDPFNGDTLVFEEASLLHSLARACMLEADAAQAVELMVNILAGLAYMPQDNKDKERLNAPILRSLAQSYIRQNNYDEAVRICEIGRKMAMKRNNGLYLPDFAELKAHCLLKLGSDGKEISDIIHQSLAGYLLLRRYEKADGLLQHAKEHKLPLNTHGMDTIRPPMPELEFAHGKAISGANVGEFITELRLYEGIKSKELCEGLCSTSVYSKLEHDEYAQDKVFLLEPIFQRLGRHMGHYFYTLPDREDFANKQIRDEINSLLINNKHDEAEVLVDELAQKKGFQKGINLQFIKLARAGMHSNRKGLDKEHLGMLHEAINVTRKDFDIGRTALTRLTYNEIKALNQMAINLCSSGDIANGLQLFEDIRRSMDRFYVDEHEKIRMYTAILYNKSLFLGRSGNYKDSMALAIEGDEIDAKHQRLQRMADFAINRACCMQKMGEKEKSLPYFALSFYCSGLWGRQRDVDAASEYVKEHLGIDINPHHQQQLGSL